MVSLAALPYGPAPGRAAPSVDDVSKAGLGQRKRAVIAGAAARSHASARGSSSLAPSSHSLRNTGSSSADSRESW